MEAATNASSIELAPSSGGSATLYIAVSLVVVLFTAAVILVAVVLALAALRRNGYVPRNGKYSLLPTAESREDGKKKPTLPFPPKVSLTDPPISDEMMFSLAPQLSDHLERGTMRYPFVKHRTIGPQASLQERRPPRLRTRRKGNHKHGKAMRAVQHRTENLDVNEESANGKGDSPPRPHVYLLPAQNQSGENDPEVFLTFIYSKISASLVVRVERVVGLPLREDGTEVSAYVQLYLTPARPAGPQRRSSKTQTARRNSTPVFDEEIRFEAMSEAELLLSTLHVEVLDYKVYGKHQLLGGTMLALSAVHFYEGEASIALTLVVPQVTVQAWILQCS